MPDDLNPYSAPESPIAEDFISVDPGPRSTTKFLFAATHYGLAVFVLTIAAISAWFTIDLWLRSGTRRETHPFFLGFKDALVVFLGASGLCFVLAGRSFGRGRSNRGLRLSGAGFGLVALTFGIGWLVSRMQ